MTTPERFDPSRSVLTGLDVLDHGLPEPPEVLTHTMSVPMAFWIGGRFGRISGRGWSAWNSGRPTRSTPSTTPVP